MLFGERPGFHVSVQGVGGRFIYRRIPRQIELDIRVPSRAVLDLTYLDVLCPKPTKSLFK